MRNTDHRVVLIAGVPRSGSTWCYNAVRLVLTAAGEDVEAGWCRDLEGEPRARWRVVKAHGPDEVSGLKPHLTFTTRRPLAECIASRQNMGWQSFGEEAVVEAARRQRALYAYWKARSDLEIDFGDICDKPHDAVGAVSGSLGVTGIDLAPVLLELSDLRQPPAGSYDPETLLHPNHINDPALTRRRAEVVFGILDRCGEPTEFPAIP